MSQITTKDKNNIDDDLGTFGALGQCIVGQTWQIVSKHTPLSQHFTLTMSN